MKEYLVTYEIKQKGRINTTHTTTEHAKNKKEIRDYYKLLKYKVIKIEEIKD